MSHPAPTRHPDGLPVGGTGGPDDGLTLLEMVVAVGVLMIVLVASLSVIATAQHAQQTAEGTDRAIQLANSQIERIRQRPWRDIGFYENTYNTATATTDYETRRPATGSQTEANVILGTTDPNVGDKRILPHRVTTEARNRFTVHTFITWAIDPALGLPTTSGTAATAGSDLYGIKRIRVTVTWQSGGTGATHEATTETWVAPQAFEEAPPGVTVTNE